MAVWWRFVQVRYVGKEMTESSGGRTSLHRAPAIDFAEAAWHDEWVRQHTVWELETDVSRVKS